MSRPRHDNHGQGGPRQSSDPGQSGLAPRPADGDAGADRADGPRGPPDPVPHQRNRQPDSRPGAGRGGGPAAGESAPSTAVGARGRRRPARRAVVGP